MREDFLSMALLPDTEGATLSSVSTKEVRDLAKQLEQAIKDNFPVNPNNGNLLYWLTEGLHWGVKESNTLVVRAFARLMLKLAQKDPDVLLAMLRETIDTGKFTGQTFGYAWINALHLSAYNRSNPVGMIAVHHVFSYLLENTAEGLAPLLTDVLVVGEEREKTALLLLARALLQAASEPFNQPNSTLVASFIENVFLRAPDEIGPAILEEIETGSFAGKSIFYFLVSAQRELSKDSVDAVVIVSRLLKALSVTAEHQEAFIVALLKCAERGPYEGVSTLQVLLMGLVSATYIKNNEIVIQELVAVLQGLLETHGVIVAQYLVTPIIEGKHLAREHGLAMFIEAFAVSSKRGVDTTSMAELFSSLIDVVNPEQLKNALCQPTQKPFLQVLVNALNHADTGELQRANISHILDKLTPILGPEYLEVVVTVRHHSFLAEGKGPSKDENEAIDEPKV